MFISDSYCNRTVTCSRSDLDLSESDRQAADEAFDILDLSERDAAERDVDRDCERFERRPMRRFNARRQLANDIRSFFNSRPTRQCEIQYYSNEVLH